jgi:hypothetical protein
MITLTETTMNKLRGQEISFYTGEDVGEDLQLKVHETIKSGILPQHLSGEIGPGLGFNLVMGFAASLLAAQEKLSQVYTIFKKCRQPTDEESTKDEDFSLSSYQLSVHELFYTLKKVCYAIILMKADKIIPRDGVMPPSIHSITDINSTFLYKNEIANEVFKHENSREVFKVIEDINNIFQTFHMYTLLNMIGTDTPTVCAFGPPYTQGYAFLIHNHAIRQIIKAVNAAIKDINLV